MELEADDEVLLWIVEGFDETVWSVGHGAEARGKLADALVVIASYLERGLSVPAMERGIFDQGDGVAVGIVVAGARVDVLEAGTLFFLHIAVQRAAVGDVEQLRAAADAEDGE